MTLGTLKIQCLKLLFANGNENITEANLATYMDDDHYRDYLILMPDSINRALADLESRCCLPTKRVALTGGTGTPPNFDLTGITDFFEIERVTALCGNEYYGSVPFAKEGGTLIILDDKTEDPTEADYTFLYWPTVQRILSTAVNSDTIDLPERFCEALPYFVKSELFREEEPAEADKARQLWETATQRATQNDHYTATGVARTLPFDRM